MNFWKSKMSVLLSALFAIAFATPCFGSHTPFPVPEAITPNVAFWTKVYTEYTTRQGIVHDDVDLSIIYEVIDLLPYDQNGATKINRRRMKQANQKYERILQTLAKHPDTKDAQCRRVARLLGEPLDSHRLRTAAHRVRCQIGQKDRFQAGLIRSGAYEAQMRAIFRAKGLPEDLGYLPHVESSFNTAAYSKFGAAGMWQFTRSTGKRFMEVGYSLDERRDPILATYAAADLLKENYEKLGCWALAITAYNHGAAGMQRAKATHKDYEAIFKSYRSRTFKFASRNFYSEFLAARQVAKNYEDYFGDIALNQPEPTQIITLSGYAAIDDLSRHLGTDVQTLKRLNPALRQPVFDGQKFVPKGYCLRVPSSTTTDGTLLAAALPGSIYRTTQKPSKFYTVQRGDTAGRIAQTHGVKLEELIIANNLNRRATIYPRQTLRIPVPGEHLREPVVTEPKNVEPVLIARAETPAPKPTPAPVIDPLQTEDTIEVGDEEAPADDITIAQVDESAPSVLIDDTEQPEDDAAASSATEPQSPPDTDDAAADEQQYPQPMLASLIPLPAPQSIPPRNMSAEEIDSQVRNEQIVTAEVKFERLTAINGRPVGIIQVEVEETLGHYAEWAKVRTQQIRNLNHLRFGSVLRLHQKIKIPLHRITAEAFEQTRYEYHKRLQEDFFAVYRIGELQAYSVQRGDTIWTLCQDKFEIPMWLLKHCNPDSDLADLRIRQQLVIPVIEKSSANDASPEALEDNSDEGAVVPEEGPDEVQIEPVQPDGGA